MTQILWFSVEGLDGTNIPLTQGVNVTFQKAPKAKSEQGNQQRLELESRQGVGRNEARQFHRASVL
jgi:hypothetical protein